VKLFSSKAHSHESFYGPLRIEGSLSACTWHSNCITSEKTHQERSSSNNNKHEKAKVSAALKAL